VRRLRCEAFAKTCEPENKRERERKREKEKERERGGGTRDEIKNEMEKASLP
jgi:hypothetical protein